jgi:hypothetical protein
MHLHAIKTDRSTAYKGDKMQQLPRRGATIQINHLVLGEKIIAGCGYLLERAQVWVPCKSPFKGSECECSLKIPLPEFLPCGGPTQLLLQLRKLPWVVVFKVR